MAKQTRLNRKVGETEMKHQRSIVAIADTREQDPLSLEMYGLVVVRKALPYGDYSLCVPDLTRYLVIERKSLADFIQCCGREHERFRKELLALRGYPYRFVVCEFSLGEIFRQEYRSKISLEAVLGCLSSWLTLGITFLFADDHEQAARLVAGLLLKKAREVLELAKVATEINEPDKEIIQ